MAAKSGDRIVAFYDPAAVTAGTVIFPARGFAALHAGYTRVLAQPGKDLTWTIDEVVVTDSGTIACSARTWRLPDQDATGPYLVVWRKQSDRRWKVLIDAAWYPGPPQQRSMPRRRAMPAPAIAVLRPVPNNIAPMQAVEEHLVNAGRRVQRP
jgi:ketosteroid isomerase-like protein